jgi:FMN-dependent NADH-azoreductase
MHSLLVIDSSGRRTRSITRALTSRFVAGWRAQHPDAEIISREVGLNPPPTVNEAWIAAAYGGYEPSDPAAPHPLTASDTFIDEILRAEAIVLGVPIYNFGMPAQLKAYFDQIIRVGRTFAFQESEEDRYRPLLAPRPVVVLVSAGDGAMLPGGALAHLNFLEPHLTTLLTFIGLTDVTFIRAGYEEYQDDRAKRSLAAAERAVDETAARLASPALS